MQVIKRDGKIIAFDEQKISNAVNKAYSEVHGNSDGHLGNSIAHYVTDNLKAKYADKDVTVEEIQDTVEDWLIKSDDLPVAKAYIRYRYERQPVS